MVKGEVWSLRRLTASIDLIKLVCHVMKMGIDDQEHTDLCTRVKEEHWSGCIWTTWQLCSMQVIRETSI